MYQNCGNLYIWRFCWSVLYMQYLFHICPSWERDPLVVLQFCSLLKGLFARKICFTPIKRLSTESVVQLVNPPEAIAFVNVGHISKTEVTSNQAILLSHQSPTLE